MPKVLLYVLTCCVAFASSISSGYSNVSAKCLEAQHDTVVVSGQLIFKEEKQHWPRYIVAYHDDLFRQKQQIVGDSIDENGKFHLKLSLTNPEEILLRLDKRLFNVYAFPNDSLSLTISFSTNPTTDDNNDLDIIFSASHKDLNRELNQYWKSGRRKLTIEKNEALMKSDSLFAFKKHRIELMNDDLTFCKEYALLHKCSSLFSKIVSSQIRFEAGTHLFDYGARTSLIPLNEEYLDFLKIINPNIKGLPLTQSYASFINRIYRAPYTAGFKNQLNIISFDEKLRKLNTFGIAYSARDSLLINTIFKHAKQKDYRYTQDSAEIAALYSKYRTQLRQASNEIRKQRDIEWGILSINLIKKMCSNGLATDLLLLNLCNEKIKNGISITSRELDSIDAQIQNKDVSLRLRNLNNPQKATYVDDTRLKRFVSQLNTDFFYVDFWATWCAPCKSEMKYSRRLEDTFKNKNITFVYLCVGDKMDDWKKIIEENKLTGTHYFLTQSEFSELSITYGIAGVPRYMLITKEGKIINADMTRPSEEGETISKIENVMKGIEKSL